MLCPHILAVVPSSKCHKNPFWGSRFTNGMLTTTK